MKPSVPRTVLITGAARRIGAAVAECFARRGWRVVVHCHRSLREAEELLGRLPENPAGHRLVQADLADDAQRRELLPGIVERLGACPDCLVNNASLYRRGRIGEEDPESVRQAFLVNFLAPFELMGSYRRLCSEGQIINLLDQRVGKTDPAAGAYALAKKSLRDATEACALAWAPRIRVNAVAPGIVLPPRAGGPQARRRMALLAARTPMRRPTPEDVVARCCLFLAETGDITGQILYADGGMHLQDTDFNEGRPPDPARQPQEDP